MILNKVIQYVDVVVLFDVTNEELTGSVLKGFLSRKETLEKGFLQAT